MSDLRLQQILLALHLLSAGVFVGTNVLVEFVFRRLKLMPPSDATQLGDRVGADITVINGTALVVLGGSGIALLYVADTTARFGEGSFWGSGYGIALALMIGLWVTLVVSATVIVFLRRAAGSPLPFSARQEDVLEKADVAIAAASWMQRLGWYNLGAGISLLLIGGFLRYGGFA